MINPNTGISCLLHLCHKQKLSSVKMSLLGWITGCTFLSCHNCKQMFPVICNQPLTLQYCVAILAHSFMANCFNLINTGGISSIKCLFRFCQNTFMRFMCGLSFNHSKTMHYFPLTIILQTCLYVLQ